MPRELSSRRRDAWLPASWRASSVAEPDRPRRSFCRSSQRPSRFRDDPDTVPVIAAAPIRVSYIAQGSKAAIHGRLRCAPKVQLIVRAVDDSDLEYFVGRDTHADLPQRDAEHRGADSGDGHRHRLLERGDVTFRFANSWNYTSATTRKQSPSL